MVPYVCFGHDWGMETDPQFLELVGKRIEDLRHAKGWTMERLAKECGGFEASQINKIEKGRMPKLPLYWIHRIGIALGVGPAEVLAPIPKLTPEEEEIVEQWRHSDEHGRETIRSVAGAMAQTTKRAAAK